MCKYVPAVDKITGIVCSLMLVAALLLVVERSTAAGVVARLEIIVLWEMLNVGIQLLGCDTTKFCCWIFSIPGDCGIGAPGNCWDKQSDGNIVVHSRSVAKPTVIIQHKT